MQLVPQPGLFITFAERAMLRVDEVVMDRNCAFPITTVEYELLVILRTRQGIGKAIPLGHVCEILGAKFGRQVSPREVKDLVNNLRLHFGVQIAASRDSEAGGYFIAATADEIEDSIRPLYKQAITELRVCKAMRGPQHTAAELAGQVRLELEKEASR